MGIKYLWDTNIAIYYLQQQLSAKAENFIDTILLSEQPIISAITEIELLCWKAATEKDMEVLLNFISDSLFIELEQSIKIKTAELRKTYRIKLPDAIIAANTIITSFSIKQSLKTTPRFSCLMPHGSRRNIKQILSLQSP